MNLNDYHDEAMRTAAGNLIDDEQALVLTALGLTGEAGEFADIVKKHVFHDHPFDREKAIKELGDILWYVARGAAALGVTLEEVAQCNIAKLQARYPNGFSSGDSLARRDASESA